METTTLHIPSNLFMYLGIMVGLLVGARVIISLLSPPKRKSRKTTRNSKSKRSPSKNRQSSSVRPDTEILRTPFSKLTWAEFERLFALYFRAQGYDVDETGVGGSDGGVDLVLTKKGTNERTAVQIKHWSDRRKVGPNIIRELHSARLNTTPKCLYGLLITSSDITPQARKEADDRLIKYWHGGALEMRLSKWSQWQGSRVRRR